MLLANTKSQADHRHTSHHIGDLGQGVVSRAKDE